MSGDEYNYDKDSVNLWVEPEQKDRWEAYLEEASDLQHMSQLVRRAVENEISGRSDQGTAPAGLQDDLNEITDAIETVAQKVEHIDKRLVTIEQAVQDDVDIRDLANRVFTVLPTAEEIEAAGASTDEAGESADPCGTLCAIADAVGEQEQHVRQALQKLQQETAQVQTTVLGGETRYYKEG